MVNGAQAAVMYAPSSTRVCHITPRAYTLSRTMLRLLCFMSIALCLAGCSDGPPARFPPRRTGDFTHEKDATLRMNHVQMLATHNSYHVRLEPAPIPEWDYFFDPITVQLEDQGVRALEIDLHFDDATLEYRVFHIPIIDAGSTCDRFDDCLAEIRRFSDAHPGHHPLFVQLEIKDRGPMETLDAQLDLIDAQIRAVFPEELLVTPDLVRGTRATLREAILEDGWPTLAVARGRTMFAFDCPRELCLAYARGGTLDGRVVFADSTPDDGFAAVMIANSPDDYARDLVEQGFIVRVFADSAVDLLEGEGDELDAALATGAQVISTDVPVARDDIPGYVASIPGGTPSRCSPVSAPEGCLPTDIEDPERIRGR